MTVRLLLTMLLSFSVSAFAQVPAIEPGVSQDLAKWRAARYSDVRYKLNLTLEKMSPVLKGRIEIRVKVGNGGSSVPPAVAGGAVPIVLDWRKIRGHEEKSTISNVSINGKALKTPPATAGGTDVSFAEHNEHLIFSDGVVMGENVITLDFTSPILTSGSAITRYVDKEDGSEYLYSLFVPSDASTAFPVFDQPDIKARFTLNVLAPDDWKVVGNSRPTNVHHTEEYKEIGREGPTVTLSKRWVRIWSHGETKPISTYVFAFAAGPWERVSSPGVSGPGVSSPHFSEGAADQQAPSLTVGLPTPEGSVYVRKSQAEKFKLHAKEVFRLNREAVKYFEEYFDYKFPFPKYDLVLIPEFPFGGMEHAGATFLREASVIFPQEPTKNDHINRATLIFHEAAHQWFGDTVTMRWFDDLWLKEGFATFTAYKAMEKIMPEMNAWKVFYERVKQAAYQTDSTKGTTPIYQEIKNLSAAKSAYGNIVYNKAPAFLRQAEFYLGEDKFQAAVRAFLKKHEFGNAGWEDLVREFKTASKQDLSDWATNWVTQPGLTLYRINREEKPGTKPSEVSGVISVTNIHSTGRGVAIPMAVRIFSNYISFPGGSSFPPTVERVQISGRESQRLYVFGGAASMDRYFVPNYQDYGYGIFLLDDKSRDYVLKNIQNEKDPFLRSMMWGALWDSVREGELDPREYVELVVAVLSKSDAFTRSPGGPPKASAVTETPKGVTLTQEDESTTALLLNRVGTAMNYYIDDSVSSPRVSKGALGTQATSLTVGLRTRVEEMLIAGMRNSPTLGQRITYYRAFLNIASSEKATNVLESMLKGGNPSGSEGVSSATNRNTLPTGRVSASMPIPLKTKDKFDIVTRLLILGDPDAPKLLADLEKTETGDDAKRYAYAAKAGIPTAENKAKYWNDFVNNKEISESWIEAAFGPWNSIRHSELTLPYLQKALQELPNHKRNRKIFFVNGWLGAFIGGQRSEEALATVNKFLSDNPSLDNDLRLKILENVDVIERAVRIRKNFTR